MLRDAGLELGTNRARRTDGDSTRLPPCCVADLGDCRTSPREGCYQSTADILRGEILPPPAILVTELISPKHRLRELFVQADFQGEWSISQGKGDSVG